MNSYKQKKNWKNEFDNFISKVMLKHHSMKMDVFLDDDGKSHYPLFKQEIKDFISSLIDETEKEAYEKGFNEKVKMKSVIIKQNGKKIIHIKKGRNSGYYTADILDSLEKDLVITIITEKNERVTLNKIKW